MKRCWGLLIFLLAGCVSGNLKPIAPENTTQPSRDEVSGRVGGPSGMVLVDHGYFRIYYDPKIRLPRYVQYTSTAQDLRKNVATRKNHFHIDPLLKKLGLPVVDPKEYLHSDYDQGHMAPSADFVFSQTANDETFVMSNMAPQKSNLNRIAWRLLENQVRKWGCGEERITVLTGPILEENLSTLKNGLLVPRQFFKIVIDETPPRKAIAFIYSQTDSGNPIRDRIVAVDDVDSKTHLKFIEILPPEVRSSAHSRQAMEGWAEGSCGSAGGKKPPRARRRNLS